MGSAEALHDPIIRVSFFRRIFFLLFPPFLYHTPNYYPLLLYALTHPPQIPSLNASTTFPISPPTLLIFTGGCFCFFHF